jgi:hypothetical protein
MDESALSERKRPLPSDSMSRNSMLESLHNVERRVDQPQKRAKRLSEDLQSGIKQKTSFAHRSHGIIGEYVRPDPGSTDHLNAPKTVDLTMGKLDVSFSIACTGLVCAVKGSQSCVCSFSSDEISPMAELTFQQTMTVTMWFVPAKMTLACRKFAMVTLLQQSPLILCQNPRSNQSSL